MVNRVYDTFKVVHWRNKLTIFSIKMKGALKNQMDQNMHTKVIFNEHLLWAIAFGDLLLIAKLIPSLRQDICNNFKSNIGLFHFE